MGASSGYLNAAVLKHVLGIAAYAQPTLYLGLSTTAPNSDGTGVTEPGAGTSYARVAVPAASWSVSTADSSGVETATATNSAEINFPTAGGAGWGDIIYACLFDALTGGNLIAVLQVSPDIIVNSGDRPVIAIGALTWTK